MILQPTTKTMIKSKISERKSPMKTQVLKSSIFYRRNLNPLQEALHCCMTISKIRRLAYKKILLWGKIRTQICSDQILSDTSHMSILSHINTSGACLRHLLTLSVPTYFYTPHLEYSVPSPLSYTLYFINLVDKVAQHVSPSVALQSMLFPFNLRLKSKSINDKQTNRKLCCCWTPILVCTGFQLPCVYHH